MSTLLDLVLKLQRELAETKAMLRNVVRTGTVAVADAQKGYRIDWGRDEDGNRVLSPWYPHPESGGRSKSWVPLSEGQIVTAVNPGGDPRQGFLVRGGFSDQNPQPSASLAENVFTDGDLRIEAASGRFKMTVGSSVIELSPGEIKLAAALITVSKVGG